MALTVTATAVTYSAVCNSLAMNKPTLIALPPYGDNLKYLVHPKVQIDEFTTRLCQELVTKQTIFPKTIIYVRSYNDCSRNYMVIKHKMGDAFTEPPGYPNLSGFQLMKFLLRH